MKTYTQFCELIFSNVFVMTIKGHQIETKYANSRKQQRFNLNEKQRRRFHSVSLPKPPESLRFPRVKVENVVQENNVTREQSRLGMIRDPVLVKKKKPELQMHRQTVCLIAATVSSLTSVLTTPRCVLTRSVINGNPSRWLVANCKSLPLRHIITK